MQKSKRKTTDKRNDVKVDFMFSRYEFLLSRGYFDIPELNIETSSFKAVFARRGILVKNGPLRPTSLFDKVSFISWKIKNESRGITANFS